MDKKTHLMSTVPSRHLKPLSIYSRMITCGGKDSVHQKNFSVPFLNFKIELVNNCAGKRKLADTSRDDGYETPAKKTFSPKALSPDLGCMVDYCSPPGKQESASPFAFSKPAFLAETQASRSDDNGQFSTEPQGNEGTVPCERVLLNAVPAFDCDVVDILCLSPIGPRTSAGFSDHVQSCKSAGSDMSENKPVLSPPVAHTQELEKGDGKGEEGGEGPKKGIPVNVDVEEDKGYLSMSYINDLKTGKDPSLFQLHPASSSPMLGINKDEHPHPETPSESGCCKRTALSAQRVSFTIGDYFPLVREPLSESVNSPVELLEGDVEEVWDIGRPMFESSMCHSVTVKLNSSEHRRHVSEKVQVIKPVHEYQATLCEEEASVDTSYETTVPLQVQVKSVVVAPTQHTSSCKPTPPLPDKNTKSSKLSPKESQRSQPLKRVRSHRPVVFDRKRDREREKQLYINSVTRHINEEQRGVHDAMNELLELMTHVADQTSGTVWQHPSDLTCRNYQIRYGNIKPTIALTDWQAKNSTTYKRFARVPKIFERRSR